MRFQGLPSPGLRSVKLLYETAHSPAEAVSTRKPTNWLRHSLANLSLIESGAASAHCLGIRPHIARFMLLTLGDGCVDGRPIGTSRLAHSPMAQGITALNQAEAYEPGDGTETGSR